MTKPHTTMKVKVIPVPLIAFPGPLLEAKLESDDIHILDLENSYSFNNESFPYESEFYNFLDILNHSSSPPIFPDLQNNRNIYGDFTEFNHLGTTGIVPEGVQLGSDHHTSESEATPVFNEPGDYFYEDTDLLEENVEVDVVSLEENTISLFESKILDVEDKLQYFDGGEEFTTNEDNDDSLSNVGVPSLNGCAQNEFEAGHYADCSNESDHYNDDHSLYTKTKLNDDGVKDTGIGKRKKSSSYTVSSDESEVENDNEDDDDDDYKFKSNYRKKRKVQRKSYNKKRKFENYDSDVESTGVDNHISKRKREQNKRAATKYRTKKKLEEIENANLLHDLSVRNKELKNIVRGREQEVKVLRQLLMDVLKKK